MASPAARRRRTSRPRPRSKGEKWTPSWRPANGGSGTSTTGSGQPSGSAAESCSDFAAYGQDDTSKQQFSLERDIGVRDFRLLFSGRFKTRRPLSWSLGYMYDGLEDEWRFRQTGITIGFPKLHGNLFVGRTKEGYSLVKVMTGYHGWTMERSPSLEFVPSVAARGVGAIEVGGPIVRGKLGNFVAAGYCGSEDPPQNSRTTRRARQVLEV